MIILRSVEVQGRDNPRGGFRGNALPYVWRGNCLYPLESSTPAAARRFALSSPDLCFPLVPGAHWRSGDDWPWKVDRSVSLSRGPRDVPPQAIRLVQETSAGPNYVWFEKGVGKVPSWTWRNGTYTEAFERLVR